MLASWVEDETKSADFGDARLDKRFKRLIADIYDRSRNSIPTACGGWKETLAAYRFFDNENVNLEGVLASHYDATLTRVSTSKVVLIAQDTTELVREKTKKPEVIRGIRTTEKVQTFLHANVAFTTERVCLGVINVAHWKREGKKDKAVQVKTPIEEKESIRWLDGYEAACAVQAHCPETLVVSVSDRESDIHALFLEPQTYEQNTRAGWIVRSMHDRLVEGEDAHKLRAYLENTPIRGTTEFTLAANGERQSRTVKQTIQAAVVPLKAVSYAGNALAGTHIHAIYVTEPSPPEGEDAIEWVLLTNLPIDSQAEIETIIQWYVCRWEIEIYFRVLKNGCQVQKLQLETQARFEACLGIYLIIAWRLLCMTMLARQCPHLPCDVILDEDEWQSLTVTVTKAPPPKRPPTLNAAIDMLAKLGGYLGRKNDSPPGTKTIWIGIQRMRDFTLAINGYKDALEQGVTYV